VTDKGKPVKPGLALDDSVADGGKVKVSDRLIQPRETTAAVIRLSPQSESAKKGHGEEGRPIHALFFFCVSVK